MAEGGGCGAVVCGGAAAVVVPAAVVPAAPAVAAPAPKLSSAINVGGALAVVAFESMLTRGRVSPPTLTPLPLLPARRTTCGGCVLVPAVPILCTPVPALKPTPVLCTPVPAPTLCTPAPTPVLTLAVLWLLVPPLLTRAMDELAPPTPPLEMPSTLRAWCSLACASLVLLLLLVLVVVVVNGWGAVDSALCTSAPAAPVQPTCLLPDPLLLRPVC